MPRMGWESTTPVFEQAKIFHALDRAATVVGLNEIERGIIYDFILGCADYTNLRIKILVNQLCQWSIKLPCFELSPSEKKQYLFILFLYI
jgi:hypothetical protein